jgi:polar amino acid transport system substrate-binding protein
MNRWIYAVTVITALLFAGCGSKGGGEKKAFTSLADFNGAKIATLSGAVFADFIDPVIPNVNHVYYNSPADMAQAVMAGRADAISLDMPVAKYLVTQHQGLVLFPDVVAPDRYGFAVAKGSQLGVKGNEALDRLREDGTLDKLADIWFGTDDSKKVLPVLNHKTDFNGSAGTLRYACDVTSAPMSYTGSSGSPVGYEIDIVSRIAYELNMNVEFVPMAFTGLLPALASGRADMVGGSMSITEERKKSVDFIGPNFEGGITLVVRKDRLGK